MKKKLLLVIPILVFVIGLVGFLLLNREKDVTTITMDINPSLKMNVTNKGNVSSIVSLNKDADALYTQEVIGKSVKEVIGVIATKAVEMDYAKDGEITIIVGLDGKDNGVVKDIENAFTEKNVRANVIVPVITEEAKREADHYGITPAKAAYVLEVIGDNEDLKFDDIMNVSAKELNTMKETGLYCDREYTLVGNVCEKKTLEEKPEEGRTCPEGYIEVSGKCSKTENPSDELYCDANQTLKDGKCTGVVTTDAKAKCDTGTYNKESGKCEELAYVSDGTKKCPSSEQKLLSNGRCASPHMGAHFDDPEGQIDPATECCCGDTWYPDSSAPGRGWCYSPAGNDDPVISCPSGSSLKTGDKGEACYSVKTSTPTYYCEGDAKLDGNKCTANKTVAAKKKLVCKVGTLFEDRICVNANDTKEFITGAVCNEKARLENNVCVYYEQVEPKHSN